MKEITYRLNPDLFSASAKLQIQFVGGQSRTFRATRATKVTPQMAQWLEREKRMNGSLIRCDNQDSPKTPADGETENSGR